MKYYLIAGEASGDIHGATLLSALKKTDSTAEFRFWGGDKMLEVDSNIVKHYSDTSFMGFVEVAKNLPSIFRFIKQCKADILAYAPDVLILIDYPGFNLRIAKWAKQQNITIIYYISPQVWAWKASRIKQMKQDIDQMYVILPFEKAFFKKHQMNVKYFGHPLKESINQFKSERQKFDDIPNGCIACLPGSRAQEIKTHLNYIIELAALFPEEKFVIAATSNVDEAVYRQKKSGNINIIFDRSYDIFSQAKAGIIASGTATLEACLFNIPQVVIYKGNPLSYQIAKRVVKLDYISLVNLIANKPIIKELIQDELNLHNLKKAFSVILDTSEASSIKQAYQDINHQLGEYDTAQLIAEDIQKLTKT